jgi:glycosyltransferase involved in cell wall biosynthesis
VIGPSRPVSTDRPLISVVIPTHNRAEMVSGAIESVRVQTYGNVEIIVVDDCSTDDTDASVRQLLEEEPRLRLISHETIEGAQAARNTGIRAATGRWLAFLDSDDTYLPDSLERRLNAATVDGTSAAHSECLARQPSGLIEAFGTPPMHGDIRHDVLSRPGPMFQAMLVRTESLEKIGYLDDSITAYQEWDTAIRLSAVTAFSFVPEPTFIYNLQGSDTISKNLRRSARGYEQVVSKHAANILTKCGPPTLARHLREASRQYGEANEIAMAWSRLLLSAVIWPFGIRGTTRIAKTLVRSRRSRRSS